ncbi:hypothetical protein VTJ83DRAFT_368 [Remersonia thermophila]|uniref:Uncharacterized protein n=1 Tax=Remersonia thermophila TaxID=72144 RepID=A0ABR4DL02_9PEZI
MLYDLNLAWSPGTPPAELERTLRFAKHLGYDVVALNHIISGPIPTQPTPITNPIPCLTPPHPSYPGGSSSSSSSSSISKAPSSTKPSTSATPSTATQPTTAPPPPPSTSSPSTNPLPTTLRRATLVITDPSTTNYRLPDFARAYDLLALRPTSDKSFAWACTSAAATSAGDPPAIISLDLASHLGWHVHHRTAMAAVARGIRFEVCYAQALGSGPGAGGAAEKQRARANFIGNVQSLVRATKGRGVILSSEARSALGLRAPADVVNLLAVWGLGPEKGFAALGEAPRSVVVNEGLKRRGFRGVVDIVKTAEGGKRKQDGDEEGKEGKQQQKKQQQQQQQQQQQGQKRKNGDGGGGGGTSGAGGGQQGEGLSKRQMKKMKKEAQQKKA